MMQILNLRGRDLEYLNAKLNESERKAILQHGRLAVDEAFRMARVSGKLEEFVDCQDTYEAIVKWNAERKIRKAVQ